LFRAGDKPNDCPTYSTSRRLQAIKRPGGCTTGLKTEEEKGQKKTK
jgi:hypothetical protein